GRELAVAEANLRFAELELDQGDSFRAEEHLALAQPAARNAVASSKECGKVTVLIREKEAPVAAPKVVLADRDGDGVPDIEDLFPDVPGPPENHGCPVFADRDGDGVPDDIDRCPDVPGPKENFGCPWPDRDHDGVPDKDDQCPDEPGPPDNHGCPRKYTLVVVRRDRIEIKHQIHFRAAKSVILPSSYELLRQVAQVIKDAGPAVRVRVEGHTDNVGKLDKNIKLSQNRADAVKTFLVRQGVNRKQLISEGYGPTHTFVTWDYRGHGQSPVPEHPENMTVALCARDLRTVANAVGAERAVLLGHSMGAQVILEAYREESARVQALVPMLGAAGQV